MVVVLPLILRSGTARTRIIIPSARYSVPKLTASVVVLPSPIGPPATRYGCLRNTVLYAEIHKGSTNSSGTFTAATGSASLSPNGYPYQISAFTNTLSSLLCQLLRRLTLLRELCLPPIPGPSRQINFLWTSVNYSGAKYEFQLAFDPNFYTIASCENNAQFRTYASYNDTIGNSTSLMDLSFIPSNTVTAVPLLPAETYYWRVRTDYPVFSKWSNRVQFSTYSPSVAVLIRGNFPGQWRHRSFGNPGNHLGNVPALQAMISRSQLIRASLILWILTNLNTTVYAPNAPLNPNTTYYWEVRAISGTASNDWVISTFTTSSSAQGTSAPPTGGAAPPPASQPVITVVVPPASQAPITVVVPPGTPSAPPTPAYIWVIIVIAAILVIAVIVLIARTRRV